MPTIVCTAKVSCKKLPGVLELTDAHLQWTQEGAKAPSITLPRPELSCECQADGALPGLDRALALFCSKEGAPQVRLKIALFTDENGHNFTFVSSNARNERDKFKKELTQIVGTNKAIADAGGRKPMVSMPAPVAALPSTPTHKLSTPISNASTPRPSGGVPTIPVSRAASVASEQRASTPTIIGSDPVNDFKLRKKVLVGDLDLAALHKDLVIGGQITEAEFWDGREVIFFSFVLIYSVVTYAIIAFIARSIRDGQPTEG
jgi:transcription initiation factor TFIIH subunit 1